MLLILAHCANKWRCHSCTQEFDSARVSADLGMSGIQWLIVTGAYVRKLKIEHERAIQQANAHCQQRLDQKDEDHLRVQSILQQAKQQALNARDSKHQEAMQQLVLELQAQKCLIQRHSLEKQVAELKASNQQLTTNFEEALSGLKTVLAAASDKVRTCGLLTDRQIPDDASLYLSLPGWHRFRRGSIQSMMLRRRWHDRTSSNYRSSSYYQHSHLLCDSYSLCHLCTMCAETAAFQQQALLQPACVCRSSAWTRRARGGAPSQRAWRARLENPACHLPHSGQLLCP